MARAPSPVAGSAGVAPAPPAQIIPHLILSELLAAGLSYGEALSLPLEELLCLLECSRYRQALAALEAERARVASLISADTDAQQRELLLLSQKARLLSARFRG